MRINKFAIISFACLILVLLNQYCALPTSYIDTDIKNVLEKAKEIGNNKKQYGRAIRLMQEIKNDGRFESAHDSSKAAIYHRIGAYNYMIRNFTVAEGYLDTAIHMRTNLKKRNPMELANSIFIRSNNRFYLRNREEALGDILNAIELVENYPLHDTVLKGYYKDAGKIYLSLGDRTQAKYYFQIVEDYVNSKDFENNVSNANLVSELGDFYAAIKEKEKASQYLEQAVEIFSSTSHFQNEAEVLISLSAFYLKDSNTKNGKLYANKALSALEQITDSTINLNNLKYKAYNNLAYAAIKEGDLDESKKQYTKINDLYNDQNIKHHVFFARSLEGFGDIAHAKKDYDEAILEYHKAVKALCLGYGNDDVYSSPAVQEYKIYNWGDLKRILKFKLVSMNSKLLQNKEDIDLQKAIYKHYKALDEINFHIRHTLKSTTSRYNFIKRSLASYEKTIDIALSLFETTKDDMYLLEAYHFASKNKALVMLDALQDEKAKFAGIPLNLLEEEKELKKLYLQLDAKLTDAEEKGDSIVDIRKRRFETIRNYQKLIDNFEKDYPNYFQLKYAHTKTANPMELASQLPENTAIIEYFIGKDNLYSFIVSKENGLQYYKKAKPQNFKTLCDDFRRYIEAQSPTAPAPSDYAKTTVPLFELLLKEELSALKSNNENLNRLILIPDDRLLQFSFDALFDKTPKKTDRWSNPNLPYLVKQYAISYAYSNQLIFDKIIKNKTISNKYPYLGIGLDYRDENFSNLVKLIEKDTSRTKGILPHSVPEIQEISKLYKNKLNFINENALKANFLNHAEFASILHLAMHGMSNLDDPQNSGLIFSSCNNEDYILTAAEIYNIKFNAALAVLSACDTGDGSLEKGEGIRSLARAFKYGGCSNVIASLWGADDQVTKMVIVQFFKNITKKGLPYDVALQQAKLHYLQGEEITAFKAPPSYWSHLITIGNMSAKEYK